MMLLKASLLRCAALVGSLLALTAAGGGCSSSSADQCTVGVSGDRDCEQILGVASGQALCDNGTCRPKGAPPPAQGQDGGGTACISTAKCTEENGGKAAICSEPGTGSCIPLENDLCHVVGKGWQESRHPIVVGVLISKVGPSGATAPYEETVLKGIQLAEAEWYETTTGGLNVGGERRPIVAVYCDNTPDPESERKAFDFLTLGAKAPAIITSAPFGIFSYIDEAAERNTFFYLSEFGSEEVAATGKLNGRVFAGFPAQAFTLPLMTEWVKQTEAKVRAARGLGAGDEIKMAILGSGALIGASAVAFIDALKEIPINGAPASTQPSQLKVVAPVERPDGTADYLASAKAVAEFAPDIVLTTEARNFHFWYLPLIEANWPSNVTYRAQYITDPSAGFAPRYAISVGSNDELRRRVSGITVPFEPNFDVFDVFDGFLARYEAYFKEPNEYTTTGYDAFYSTAYGIAASLTTPTVDPNRLTGADIGAAMKRITLGAEKTALDPVKIPNALATLANGGTLDLVGTTGDLDWVPETGAADADSSVYCVTRGPAGVELIDSGLFYRYRTKAVSGAFDDVACQQQ